MKTQIYYRDISYLYSEEAFEEAATLLPAWRLERIMNFKRQRDRARGAGAFLLLEAALEQAAPGSGLFDALRAGDICFEYGPNKKPYLSGHKDVFFNLSHSGDMVMCIVSDRECGCDVQDLERFDEKIAERFFHEREKEYLKSLPVSWRNRAFYRIWVKKESYIKATGLGMSTELGSFCVPLPGEGLSGDGLSGDVLSGASGSAAAEKVLGDQSAGGVEGCASEGCGGYHFSEYSVMGYEDYFFAACQKGALPEKMIRL